MPFDIIIAGTILLITLCLLVIRTNSAVVFFSICAGSVLASQIGGELSLIITSFIKDGDTSKSIAEISLIVLPMLFSAIILRKSVSSGALLLNIVPSLASGGFVVFLIMSLLGGGLSGQIMQGQVWGELSRYQPFIVVVGVVSGIVSLGFTQNGSHRHKSKHKSR